MTMRKKGVEVKEGKYIKGRRCLWTSKEDEILLSMASRKTTVDWVKAADMLNSLKEPNALHRTPKQCRERWHNRVNPAIKTSPWSQKETDRFFELFKEYGPKWSHIAYQLSGRTDNTVKNFFYCRLRKIARRIKKSIITEDMKTTPKEIEYNLFLVRYLKSYFVGDKGCPINDKYIIEMTKTSDINLERIKKYLKNYQASVKSNFQANETEDFTSKSNSCLLPNSDILIKQKEDRKEIIQETEKKNSFTESDIRFFAQLLFMENNQILDINHIKLPEPKSSEEAIAIQRDNFQPTFYFNCERTPQQRINLCKLYITN